MVLLQTIAAFILLYYVVRTAGRLVRAVQLDAHARQQQMPPADKTWQGPKPASKRRDQPIDDARWVDLD